MKRLARWVAQAAVLCVLAACASVPSTDELAARSSQIRIASDAGWLSFQRSDAIVKKLDRNAQAQGTAGAPPDAGQPRNAAGDASGASAGEGFLYRHLQVEEAIAGAPMVIGNRVKLLADGPATYRAMLADIRAARQYVHMESYIFDDDEAGREFADAFIAKRGEGVSVALMVDGVGTLGTPDALFKRMRDAGVQVVVFNPVNPAKARAGWAPNNRDHRKLLVVDGKVGFLGGINISSVYSSSPSASGSSGASGSAPTLGTKPDAPPGVDAKTAPWRDTQIRVEGPAVAEIERVMQAGWEEQHGPPLDPREFFPRATPRGDMIVRIIANRPGDKDGYTLYLTLMSAVQSAQKSIHITMAYFVPDPAFVQALGDAARRGVDVALVLPGFSDSSLVFHAGRSYYSALLEAGVKVYERRDAMLHAKTVVVDGVWSTVGSSNMDWRSFALNYELNAVILGAEFGAQMENLFAKDVEKSTPIEPATWQDRGAKDRFMESFSRLFER